MSPLHWDRMVSVQEDEHRTLGKLERKSSLRKDVETGGSRDYN